MQLDLVNYLVAVAALSALTWGGTQGLGLFVAVSKRWIALVVGPVLALVAHGAGLLPVPNNNPGWGWGLAFLTGLLGTAAAAWGNDTGKALRLKGEVK